MAIRTVLIASVKVAAVFVLSIRVLGLFTFVFSRKLGLEL